MKNVSGSIFLKLCDDVNLMESKISELMTMSLDAGLMETSNLPCVVLDIISIHKKRQERILKAAKEGEAEETIHFEDAY